MEYTTQPRNKLSEKNGCDFDCFKGRKGLMNSDEMRGDYVLNIQGISYLPHILILIHNPFAFEFTFPEEQKLF